MLLNMAKFNASCPKQIGNAKKIFSWQVSATTILNQQ